MSVQKYFDSLFIFRIEAIFIFILVCVSVLRSRSSRIRAAIELRAPWCRLIALQASVTESESIEHFITNKVSMLKTRCLPCLYMNRYVCVVTSGWIIGNLPTYASVLAIWNALMYKKLPATPGLTNLLCLLLKENRYLKWY